jgi:hypothetical protein
VWYLEAWVAIWISESSHSWDYKNSFKKCHLSVVTRWGIVGVEREAEKVWNMYILFKQELSAECEFFSIFFLVSVILLKHLAWSTYLGYVSINAICTHQGIHLQKYKQYFKLMTWEEQVLNICICRMSLFEHSRLFFLSPWNVRVCHMYKYLWRLHSHILGILFWVTEQDFGHKTEIPVAITMTRGL